MMTSLLCPDAFLSPLEIDAVVTRALAEDLGRAGDITIDRDHPAKTRGARRRGGAQGRRDRRPAVRRRDASDEARAVRFEDRCVSATAPTSRQDRADDGRGSRARGARRPSASALNFSGTFPASRPRPHEFVRRVAHRCASAARARPRRGCGRWRNMRCAAAAASTIASASTTRS